MYVDTVKFKRFVGPNLLLSIPNPNCKQKNIKTMFQIVKKKIGTTGSNLTDLVKVFYGYRRLNSIRG